MFSKDLQAGSASRDAIDGFEAIAVALDRGLDSDKSSGSRLRDILAIAAGWLVLGAIVLYPSLQLVAILICAACLGVRWFGRLILGPSPSTTRQRESLFAA